MGSIQEAERLHIVAIGQDDVRQQPIVVLLALEGRCP